MTNAEDLGLVPPQSPNPMPNVDAPMGPPSPPTPEELDLLNLERMQQGQPFIAPHPAAAPVMAPPSPPVALPLQPQVGIANPALAPEAGRIPQLPRIPSGSTPQPFDAASEQLRKGLKEAAIVGAQKATAEAAYAQTTANLIGDFEKKTQERQAENDRLLSEGRQKADKARDEAGKFEYKNWWTNAGTGSQIGAALAMALGAMGAAYSGGRNTAADIVNSAIDRDLQVQKLGYEKLKDKATGAESAYSMLAKQLGDKDLAAIQFQKIGLEKVKAQTEAATAKYASAEVKAKGQQLLGELDMKIAEKNAEYEKNYLDKQIKLREMTSGKDLNKNQWDAAGFAKRMETANSQLEELTKGGKYNPAGQISSAVQGFPERLQSAEAKQYNQLIDNFASAVLRKESGAAISATERADTRKAYFPSPGDDAKTLEQKAILRQQATSSFKAEAGRAYDLIPSANNARVLMLLPSGNTAYIPIGNKNEAIRQGAKEISEKR